MGVELQRFINNPKNFYVSLQTNYAIRQFEDTSEGFFFKNHKSDVYTFSDVI